MSIDPRLRRGRQLLCLPGTHTKWVLLADGVVDEFLTAPTGELFALLRDHSVLLRECAPLEAAAFDTAAFGNGLAQSNEFPHAQLLHRLFECRARRLDGELGAPASVAFLSGLLIGSDIGGALRLLAGSIDTRSVHLIGASELTRLYAIGLATHDYTATCVEGVAASVAGLAQLHRQLARRQVADATR